MIYCMADIHGETDKFHEMLKPIEFSPQDTLYIIGDVIDRCPGGVDILQEIISTPNIIMLLGNHEDMCLKTLGPHSEYGARDLWRSNGGSCTYREMVYHTTPIGRQQILDFLSSLPRSVDITVGKRKFHLVHGWPSEDEEEMIWARPHDHLGRTWPSDVTAIIGHTPTIYMKKQDDGLPFGIHHGNGFIMIDCGCGNTTNRRRLACLRLDDMKEYYV